MWICLLSSDSIISFLILLQSAISIFCVKHSVMTSTTSNNPTAFLTNPSVQLDVTRYLGTASDYVNRGIIMKLPDNTEFYAAGTRQTKNGVIILPDYSGWNSGRIRNLCDFFGDHNCFAVVPNFSAKGYEGNSK
jgi:hypothetical protein